MRSLALLITLGVFLVLLPSLGLPARIDDHFIFVIGIILITLGLLIRRGMLPREESIVNQAHDIKVEN